MNKWLRYLLVAGSFAMLALSILIPFAAFPAALAVQTVVTGARATAGAATAGGIDQNSRVIDMSDTIYVLDPNEAPLTAITMRIAKKKCINPKFEWLEDDYLPTQDLVNGTTFTAGTTAIVVDNGSYFRPGDVLKHLDSGEVMYVSAVVSNTLTVVRSVGATAAATPDDNDVLLIIGNANAENATGRTIKTTQKTPQNNVTEIFRWPFGASRTLMNSETYGGSDWDFQRRINGIQHRIQMERAFLFGEKDDATAVTGATGPIRFCDGVIARISTNVTTLAGAGTLTTDVFETFLRTGFRYGPGRKIFFASRQIISFLSLIAVAKIQTKETTKEFPLKISEWISGHGQTYLVTHNLLEGDGANSHSYQGWGLLLDIDSIWYRFLTNSDTSLKTNIQANDQDGRVDEYLTECAPMIVQEQNHSILRGVNTYS